MRGLKKMVALAAPSILTLACQGCVSMSPAQTVTPPLQIYEIRSTATSDAVPTGPVIALSSSSVWTQSDGDASPERLAKTPPAFATGQQIMTFGPAPAGGEVLSTIAAERVQEQLIDVPRDQRAFNGEIALSAPAGNFAVGIAPRFSVTRDGAYSTKRVGGEVRIGQNFDQRGNGEANSSWYLFAGADGEALVWEPDSAGSMEMSMNDMALRDKVTVGDMQAGVSLQRGDGQLSLSYIRREIEYSDQTFGINQTEDFAGVSFTIRR